jgi:AGZA family xanthine/uracil permease-like MFS transporter
MKKEILAGLSSFFTVSYLLLLYPKILSEGGIDFGAALTATILTLFVSTLFLALYAKFPVVLAPGLSVGPFLVYSVILKQQATWQTALGIVFWAGLAIFLLSVFKIRQKILLSLPHSIKAAAIGGIGLFLICIGVKDLDFFSGAITLFGLVLFFTLYARKFSSAFLITIFACWALSLLFGATALDGLAALPSSLKPTFFQLDLVSPLSAKWIGLILSVALIALFDTSASLAALSELSGTTDSEGHIENIDKIVIPDGLGSMFAALLGTGTLAFTLESSSGLKAGGRTPLTPIIAAFCSLAVLFFHPLINSIPFFASTAVLIAIGIFMTQEIRTIHWNKYEESVPAALTLAAIPLTFSIYTGFSAGFVSYALIQAIRGKWKQVHPVCWVLALIFAAHLIWSLYVGF